MRPRRVVSLKAAGIAFLTAALAAVPIVSTSVAAQGATCAGSYAITSQWSGGFNWVVTVSNTGALSVRLK